MKTNPTQRYSSSLFPALFSLFIVTCSLFIVNCSNPFTGGGNGDGGQGTAQSASGTGSVSVQISGNAARTILPGTTGALQSYKLVFTPSGGSALPDIDRNNGDIGNPIHLEAGTYALHVTGYTDTAMAKPAATGTASVAITSGNNTPCTVTMTANGIVAGTQGAFSWNVTLPSGGVDAATMAITSLTPPAGADGPSQDLITSAAGSIPLPSDYYQLTLTLTNGAANQSVTWLEALHVYQNLTSHLAETFADADFTSKKYTVTFDYNYAGGPANSMQTRAHGTNAAAPSAPTRSLYAFDGWYTSGGTKYDFASATVTADITLYAKWLRDLSTATIGGVSNVTYTGSPHTPTVTVTHDGATLTKDTHYTVSYGANTAVATGGSVAINAVASGGTTGTKTGTFAIGKATPAITAVPSGATITYGAALSTSALSGGVANFGVASVPGAFAWDNGATVPTVSNSGYQVTFTPTDTANYNTVANAGTASITVNRAAGATLPGGSKPTVSGSTPPTKDTIVVDPVTPPGNGQDLEYAISTNPNEPNPDSLTWQDGTTFTPLNDDTTYYVYVRPKQDGNHNAGTPNVSDGITTAPSNFTVTFDANGGSGAPSTQSVTPGSQASYQGAPATAPAFTIVEGLYLDPVPTDRYVFVEWRKQGESTAYNWSDAVNGDITLVAAWKSPAIDLSGTVGVNIVEQAVNYVNANANAGAYTLYLENDYAVGTQRLNTANARLSIIGLGGERTIQHNGVFGPTTPALFAAWNQTASLTLGNGITLNGLNDAGNVLVYVNGGTLTMNPGSRITGHTTSSEYGVMQVAGATGSFIMNGGTITGNVSTSTLTQSTGGVFVASSAQFTMTGGSISGNTQNGISNDVFVNYSAGTTAIAAATLSNNATIGAVRLAANGSTVRSSLTLDNNWAGSATLDLRANVTTASMNTIAGFATWVDKEVLKGVDGSQLNPAHIGRFTLGRFFSSTAGHAGVAIGTHSIPAYMPNGCHLVLENDAGVLKAK